MTPRPGETWRFEDGTIRLVLSHATYNASNTNTVITAAVVDHKPRSFQPFAVETVAGYVLADRILTHPRHWLTDRRVRISDDELAAVRAKLIYLLIRNDESRS